ncbi:GNAT family N-acetyltransferase [Haladaptatus salinisoli]|uniref:GNAT family N-acetyltransferase n=1 Tax=Haladaptatus salinisoli TaxID=2884876 RepID=UPI001D09E943|nr:GNAT family N-acetyltransferase [Haladaptatus salinisoli]
MPEIQTGYIPGALGRIIELHETYYSEYWDLDYEFSREVAVELAEFLGRYDDADNRLWLVMSNPDTDDEREVMGSLVIDGGHNDDEEGARLRWVVLAPELHGQGLGRELMNRAIAFCEEVGFERVYLWTYEGLEAARHLYEERGFTLVEEETRQDWGPEITHQKFEIFL